MSDMTPNRQFTELARLKIALGRLADSPLPTMEDVRAFAHAVLLGADPQEWQPVPKERQPGTGWKLSDGAKRDIEAIEQNHRDAMRRAGSMWLD